MIPAEAKLYFYVSGSWSQNHDVLPSPPLAWEYGIEGAGPTDLLATTGFLNAYLDNSPSNLAGLAGRYSPGHANIAPGFVKGAKVKVTLPNYGDWEQEFFDDITAFDTVSPAWDREVYEVADFDGVLDPDNDLNDTENGIELTFDDDAIVRGSVEFDAINQTEAYISWRLDWNDLAIEVGKVINFIYVIDGAAQFNVLIRLRNNGGVKIWEVQVREDGGGMVVALGHTELMAGDHIYSVYVKRATAPGANDGISRVYYDHVLLRERDDIDNDTLDFDKYYIGVNWTNSTTFGGSLYLNDIKLDPKGGPFVDTLAAQRGDYGLVFPVMDTTNRYVGLNDPVAETICVYEGWLNPSVIVMGTNETLVAATSDTISTWVQLKYNGSTFQIAQGYKTDAPAFVTSDYINITDEWHHIRVEWVASSGANDGYTNLYIDGILVDVVTGIDNDTMTVGAINLGALNLAAGTYGHLYLDGWRWSNQLEQVKFIGNISAIRPASGLFEHPAVEVEAHDFMGFLTDQELGILPVQETKRADEALTTALTSLPIQPISTDFDTGVETFLLVFDTESPKSTMASFFQKMCRNELGRVYSEGNGTLRFEKRGARDLITYPDFELDGLMSEFDVSYERKDIYNIVQATITVVEASVSADVLLWDMKVAEYFGGVIPAIAAGETLVLICPFTDPALNTTISAINVVDPIENIEFGSVADFESNDMIGDLDFSQEIGGNATIVTMENTHGADTGYLNDLQIYGRALYTYGARTVEARDQVSIDSGIGERRFVLRLDEIPDEPTALALATIIRDAYSDSHLRSSRINFMANQSWDLLQGGISIEPSTMFTAIESVTGISKDFYVNRVKYVVKGSWIWISVLADPVRA